MDSEFAQRGRTLRRGKTLNRPERHVAQAPMLNGNTEKDKFDGWVIFSRVVTFWAPSFIMRKAGFPSADVIQAWREKFALCFIIACICGAVVFLTLLLPTVFCNEAARSDVGTGLKQINVGKGKAVDGGYFIINQKIYKAENPTWPNDFPKHSNESQIPDYSNYFNLTSVYGKPCGYDEPDFLNKFQAITLDLCSKDIDKLSCKYPGNYAETLQEFGLIQDRNSKGEPVSAGYSWGDVYGAMTVVDGYVLDFSTYKKAYPNPNPLDPLDTLIRTATDPLFPQFDSTRLFYRNDKLKDTIGCLKAKYATGKLQKASAGCFGVDFFMTISLIVILAIILTRFAMAFVFHWFISDRLSRRPKASKHRPIVASKSSPWGTKDTGRQLSSDPNELFTILLVTCYSEGEASMKTTIDSLADTDFSDDKKLLFIVADGVITGSGESKSTPDICLDLIEVDPAFENPEPQSYIAVAAGHKQHNTAKVYAGHYNYKDHRVPVLVVIKWGNEEEQGKPKPGNRGKRDSQLILMNFFSRVIYNERMTPLDYDMFRKIHHLMGVTPDLFETVLMVDADTKVYPNSLKLLTNCLINDPLIMGLCGETKIANKRDSWVTAIQVFEYYISHHLGKGFESVFGGVTCLPGCFCMYRLKAPKGDNDWVPVITKPEIVTEYSQNIVETLHQKNLLLLGEDRFLTTLMLRNFPNRKMMFLPQAVCKTVVPDTFSVLLSQRRRWINSTIHNLLELVLVRNLCGTFCFSMQFVIFMELIGTVVLPVAIIMTFVLIANIAISASKNMITDFASAMPLVMLVMVLFSPALLILITTRKLIYVAWMMVYLLALPVWNFILPVYSYWHFDDFSWGATRLVEGEAKGAAHGGAEGDFDASTVPLRRWEDYERRRRRSIRRKERQTQDQKPNEAYQSYESEPQPYYYYNDQEESSRSDSPDLGPPQTHYQYGSGVGNAIGNSYSHESAMTGEYDPSQMPQQPHDGGRDRPMGPRPLG